MRCSTCGLTYSNSIYSPSRITKFYKQSLNPEEKDLKNSAKVYSAHLKSILKFPYKEKKVLDIGCGDGFFLSEIKKLGFRELYGVEPSRQAVESLIKGLNRKKVILDIFKKDYFKKDFFDLITFFQVFDHLVDPNKFLKDCYFILKPGGYILAIMHNAHSLQTKILGEKSPIFDFQHIYLFDKKTVRQIFENNGFIVEKVTDVTTVYSFGYWLKMAPLPQFIKDFAINHQNWSLFNINIPLNIGNMAIIARKKPR